MSEKLTTIHVTKQARNDLKIYASFTGETMQVAAARLFEKARELHTAKIEIVKKDMK